MAHKANALKLNSFPTCLFGTQVESHGHFLYFGTVTNTRKVEHNMSAENRDLNEPASLPEFARPNTGRIFGRRHFLSGAALAGLASATGGGIVKAAEPLDPRHDPAVQNDYPYVDVRTFGARGDGKTDDTRAIQKAVASVAAHGGKLVFPAGVFVVSSVITVECNNHLWIAGAGKDVTYLVSKQPNASILSFSGYVYTLSDMSFQGSSAARSGSLLTTSCDIENITRCTFRAYHNGINALGNLGLIRDCSWRLPLSTDSNGIIVNHYAGGLAVDGAVMFPNPPTVPVPHSGIQVQSCGALQISNSNLMYQNNDLLISPPKGQVVASVNAINTFFDTATTGINISPQGGAVVRCSFTQCWASSHSKSGVSIGGSGYIDGIQFIGLQANFCKENGLSINSPATNIMVEGGEGVSNKMAAIYVGDGVKGVMVNHFFGGAGFGVPDGNNYGIYIGKDCDNYQIANCHLLGNKSGAIRDDSISSAAKRIVVNNMI